MYHVLSTGTTAILLYFISYFFYKSGFYPVQIHRRFWNIVLAVTFLFTILAGITLAIQANYKLNIPFIKTLLKWHVEIGVVLGFSGIFHLTWHLGYYFKKQNSQTQTNDAPLSLIQPVKGIRANLFLTGFLSSSVQFLLLREMMNITGGYELISGTFLGSWLISSAAGASLAGKSQLNNVRRINLIFSISPLISLFLLLFLSRVYLHPGETPSVLVAVIYTFIILFPFCFTSGFTFIKLLGYAAKDQGFIPGKSFSIETSGGIFSGIFLAVLTSGIMGTYKLLLLITLSTIAYYAVLYYVKGRVTKNAAIVVSVVAIIILTLSHPDVFFRQILLSDFKVTSCNDTPYGNITTGNYKGEESTFYNQRLLVYSNDSYEREEDIHYAMLQCDSPEKVILISGSLQSHLPELDKYNLKEITYIERDPWLTRHLTGGSFKNGNLKIINEDAYSYIQESQISVNAIILLVPPPTTLLLNRYYTTEFFTEAKRKLKPGGIFLCSPGTGDSYYNKESVSLYSSIFNSLSACFKNVSPIVGNKLYFLASDKDISLSICSLVENRHLKNIYVSSDYLDDEQIKRKSLEVSDLMDRHTRQNRTSFPIACLHSQSFHFSKDNGEKALTIVLLCIVFVLPVFTVNRRILPMYFTASALAGFEIIILLTLQIIAGNMYQLTGLLIAGLMAGLAAGSGRSASLFRKSGLWKDLVVLLIFYGIIGLLYSLLSGVKSSFITIALILIAGFIPAFITGDLFRVFTSGTGSQTPRAVYSADLAGSAFGFILISGYAVPAFGIRVSGVILAVLVALGLIFGKINNSAS